MPRVRVSMPVHEEARGIGGVEPGRSRMAAIERPGFGGIGGAVGGQIVGDDDAIVDLDLIGIDGDAEPRHGREHKAGRIGQAGLGIERDAPSASAIGLSTGSVTVSSSTPLTLLVACARRIAAGSDGAPEAGRRGAAERQAFERLDRAAILPLMSEPKSE
jgi:hypothetical protein